MMPKAEVRNYLRQYKLAAMRLESLTAEHERLQSALFSITSSQGSASSGCSDRVGNGVSRLVDLVADIDREIAYYSKTRSEVKRLVDAVTSENAALGQCLHYRYIDFDSADVCAYRMGFHPSYERKLHANALEVAARLIDQTGAQMSGKTVL